MAYRTMLHRVPSECSIDSYCYKQTPPMSNDPPSYLQIPDTSSQHVVKNMNGPFWLFSHLRMIWFAKAQLCPKTRLQSLPKFQGKPWILVGQYGQRDSVQSYYLCNVELAKLLHQISNPHGHEMNQLHQPVKYYPNGIMTLLRSCKLLTKSTVIFSHFHLAMGSGFNSHVDL